MKDKEWWFVAGMFAGMILLLVISLLAGAYR